MKRSKVICIVSIVVCYAVAAGGILYYHMSSPDDIIPCTDDTEHIDLTENVGMKNGVLDFTDDEIYIDDNNEWVEDESACVNDYYTCFDNRTTHESENTNEYENTAAYKNAEDYTADADYDDTLEVSGDEGDEIETLNEDDNVYHCEYEETDELGAYEETKRTLLDVYGRAEFVMEDEYETYTDAGIIEFCEIDIDKDGKNELLCFRLTDEKSLDCIIYAEHNGEMEQIYSFKSQGKDVQQGYGGLAVRDGDTPHVVWLNRETPVEFYYMEEQEIKCMELGCDPEYSEFDMATLYGYMEQDYQAFTGESENYTEALKIYGEQFFQKSIE